MLQKKRITSRSFLFVCALTSLLLMLALSLWPSMASAEESQIETRAAATQTMYRLYNPNSGEHFYTANVGERDATVRAGWNYEGQGWVAPVNSRTPVYRLYSGTDHHYTTSSAERDMLVRAGWSSEGIGWYSDDAQGVPLYRQFNPNVDPSAPTNNSGSHNYTTSKSEHDFLCANGWQGEGIAWYGCKGGNSSSGGDGSIVYRDDVKVLSAKQAWGFDESSFKAYAANGSSLKVGDVVAIMPDTARGDYSGGDMRIKRIDTSVTPNVIYGEAPAFEEVFKSMHVDTSTTGVANVTSANPVSAFAVDRSAKLDDWTWDFGETNPGSGVIGFNLQLDFKGEDDGEEYSFGVSGTFAPSADISVEYDGATFSEVSVVNTSTANITVSGEATTSHTFPLGEFVQPTPIPGLTVMGQLELELSASGSAELGVTFTSKAGVHASKNGLEPIYDASLDFNGNASIDLGLDLAPTLGAGIGIFPIANMSLVAGPHIGATVAARTDGPPTTCIDASAWLKLDLSVNRKNGGIGSNDFSVLGAVAGTFHFSLPTFSLLKNDDDNPMRYDFMHCEDGEFVPECTYWDRYEREPAWTEPNISNYNRLAAPFVIDEGQCFSIGDKDGISGSIGGLGVSLEYQIPRYNYELSRDCVLRVTLYDEDGKLTAQYLEGSVRGRGKNAIFREGSSTNSTLVRRNFSQRTTYEVLKGKVLVKGVLTRQAPTCEMCKSSNVFDSYADALAAFKRESAIS